jgi:hypothetical protein
VQETYRHLGILFNDRATWDDHLQDLTQRTSRRVDQLTKFLKAPSLEVPVKLKLIKACLLPVLEYGSAVWHASASQAALLTTQYLRALKMVLACPRTTPTEAVLIDLGMPTLHQRWDLNKVRFQHKLQNMDPTRHPHTVLNSLWPGRGKHMWTDKLANIWRSLIPDQNQLSSSQQRLEQLSFKAFDLEARLLLHTREQTQLTRGMRSKSKLVVFKDLHTIETAAVQGQNNAHTLKLASHPKQYLRGCLTPAIRNKFRLRAGNLDLQQELERRSRNHRSSSSEVAPVTNTCHFCPSIVENPVHFMVICPQYQTLRERMYSTLPTILSNTLQSLPPLQLATQLLADNVGTAITVGLTPAETTQARRTIEECLHAMYVVRKSLLSV